jgi:pimeloyl-ACP methyl ester carboxylesterase
MEHAPVIREHRGRRGMLWFDTGPADGPVIVFFHGTAKERDDLPFPDVADELGVRLLMVERPGYQRSAPRRGATFANLSRLIAEDLDELGIERFAALGFSGGGPHALACAEAMPSRVRAVGLLSSWSPMDPPDPELSWMVRFGMRVAATCPRSVVKLMLIGERRGSDGMVDDVCRVGRPWGFDVDQVASSVPVVAWHPESDPHVPIAPWRAFGNVQLNVVSGDSHEITRDRWATALGALASDEPKSWRRSGS